MSRPTHFLEIKTIQQITLIVPLKSLVLWQKFGFRRLFPYKKISRYWLGCYACAVYPMYPCDHFEPEWTLFIYLLFAGTNPEWLNVNTNTFKTVLAALSVLYSVSIRDRPLVAKTKTTRWRLFCKCFGGVSQKKNTSQEPKDYKIGSEDL